MAFNAENFSLALNKGGTSYPFNVWMYTTTDAKTDLDSGTYFAGIDDTHQALAGDMIIANTDTSASAGSRYQRVLVVQDPSTGDAAFWTDGTNEIGQAY